ncbi:hypothetical protein [Musicola paradisiaca]|uniref:Lipoprotein n=1 Tax=Musicola paradisiaca (strain Ech703) TaxID=579405 RepID=C6C4G3_MUSP7|nr:hypothetical protein [Musicola paradisiaca]ACS85537.1 hypothetical protein Dd703_1741 [Musicola paradisiaca Ech703]
MKKRFLVLAATTLLSGCSLFSFKTTYLNASFTSPYYMAYNDTHSLDDSLAWNHTIYLTSSLEHQDEIRGTYKASMPKIALNYRAEAADGGYQITYYGTVSYLLSPRYHKVGSRYVIEGDKLKEFPIARRTVHVTEDKKAVLRLTDDIRVDMSLEDR